MREELIVNCLHLPHRLDREESARQQAKEQGFYLRFWDGFENRTNRKEGICRGHKMIVRDAKENGYPYVCVMEDDAIWFAPKAWEYFLDTMPVRDWDIFFAMVYVAEINKENRIISVFSGMTCYIVAQKFYDFFLSLPDDCHIDRELGLTANIHRYLVADKFCCYQNGSKSDNNQSCCDYSSYLIGRKIYGKDD